MDERTESEPAIARTTRKEKRRPRGEGSISHKGSTWIVRFWADGRRLKRTCASQADALTALDELKRRAALGIPLGPYSVSSALDDFLEHGERSRGWAPATSRSYRSAIDTQIRPVLGKRQLIDLAVRDVQRLIDRMLANGHAGRHVAHVRGVLRAAIAHAMRQELVHRNVAALAASPVVRRAEMRALSATELQKVFAALDGERLRCLIVTGATLGLRRGELTALRWEDIDLDGATLTVRRTGARIGKHYVEGPPKSPRSRRTISLPQSLVALLRTQRASVGSEKLALGSAWHDEGRAFPNDVGGPTSAMTIARTLNRALVRANLPHIRVHDLRHTAATSLLAAGGSLRDVQEMLGHSSYALTADVYAHVLEDQRKATADRLEHVLSAAISGA